MSSAGEDEDELNQASLIILFLIIALLCGIFSRDLSKRIGFPYTPLLLIFGLLLGGFQEWGDITKSTDNALNIDPHSILVLLLPLLIFESAYNSHTEVLQKNFWQVMIIVGPGVLMMTFFLSFIIYYVLDYGGDGEEDMTYESTLVLGTILATTDPVAVVALLKDLGAPLHIETLIEMESLFNDGVAMVFFSIFGKLARGDDLSFGDGVEEFFSLAFGGPALGLAFGIGALILLTILVRGTTLFISMVVLVSYTVFLTAEEFLDGDVSGLLALVVAGIVMNIHSKDYMTNKQQSYVGTILQYLQFLAETILFFLSGVFIGDILIDNPSDTDHIQGSDWWKTVVLYVFLVIGRVLMFLILKIPLQFTGEGFTWKELWVASWGGLRGALALALALIIFSEEGSQDGIKPRTQTLILFHVSAQTLLTLLINGTTSGYLVEKIGLVENAQIKLKFKQNYLKEVKEQAQQQRDILQTNSYFDMVEWKGVDKLIDLQRFEQKQGWSEKEKLEIRKIGSKKRNSNKNQNSHLGTHSSLQQGMVGSALQKLQSINDKKQVEECSFSDQKYQKIRYDFLRIFMKIISNTKSKEWISKRVFQLIFDAAEENSEKLEHPISMWHLLKPSIASEKKLRILSQMASWCCIGQVVNYWFYSELSLVHEMIYIFTTVINDTKLYIKDHSVNIHQRNIRKTQDMNQMLKEFDKDFYLAKDYMNIVKKNHYEALGKLEQRKAAVKIIMSQAKMVDEHINTHYIAEKEGNEIKEYLTKRIEKLQSIRTLIHLTSQSEDCIYLFFKDTLDNNEIDHLLNFSSNHTFEKDEDILLLDQDVHYVYYISYGEIEETIYPVFEDVKQEKSCVNFTQGQVVGLTNLVDPEEKSLIALKAKCQTHLKALPIKELSEFYFNDGAFEAFCLKKCLYQFLHLSQRDSDLWARWGSKNIDEINQIAQESKCIRLLQNENIRIQIGGYLYTGILESLDGETIIDNYSLIPPNQTFIARDLTILLEFQKTRKQVLNHQGTAQLRVNHGLRSKEKTISRFQAHNMSHSKLMRKDSIPQTMNLDLQRKASLREAGGSFILLSKQNQQVPLFDRPPTTTLDNIEEDQNRLQKRSIHENLRHMRGINRQTTIKEADKEEENIKNEQCQGDDGQLDATSMLQVQQGTRLIHQNSIRASVQTNQINMDDISKISINEGHTINIDKKDLDSELASQQQAQKQEKQIKPLSLRARIQSEAPKMSQDYKNIHKDMNGKQDIEGQQQFTEVQVIQTQNHHDIGKEKSDK